MRQDKYRVDNPFFDGWDFHIVTVKVAEVGIGIGWGRECFSLKLYSGEGEDGVLPVHNAVTVVNKDI